MTATLHTDIIDTWIAADSWKKPEIPQKPCKTGAPFTVQIVNSCTSSIANVDIGDSYTNRTNNNVISNEWVPINSGISNLNVFSFAKNGTGIFVSGRTFKVYLSTNNGQSWTDKSNGLPVGVGDVNSIIATSGNTLFASTGSGDGVFRTINNGDSWTAVNTGITNLGTEFLFSFGSNIFVATNGGGVFRSSNNGDNWTAVNTGLTNTDCLALAAIGNNIFVGTLGGVFRSIDNGDNWTAVNTGLADTNVRTLFADSNGNLWVGNEIGGSAGIFLSTNNGNSWTQKTNGLTNTWVHAFARNANIMYAGTVGGGVFRSTNDGDSWTAINTGLSDLDIYDFLIDGNNFYAATAGGGVNIRNFSNYGQNSNINITTPLNGLNYSEFLAQSENAPVKIVKTEIISTTAGQLEQAITITHRDSSGKRQDHVFEPVLDPFQNQTDRIQEKYPYLFDGYSRIRLNQVNGNATVIIRFYPEQCGKQPNRAPDYLPGEKFKLPEVEHPNIPVMVKSDEITEWENTPDGNPIKKYTKPEIVKAMPGEFMPKEVWKNTPDGNPIVEYSAPLIQRSIRYRTIAQEKETIQQSFEKLKKKEQSIYVVCLQ